MTRLVRAQSGLDDIETYVPGRPIEEVQREFGLDDVIKLASNENPIAPAPKAVVAMQAPLTQVNRYPDGESYCLRQALASHLAVEPEQILEGDGPTASSWRPAWHTSIRATRPSSAARPSRSTTSTCRRCVVSWSKTPHKDYRLDLEAMLAAITPKTKLIFVCNPNNPTGTIVTATEVEAFMRAVPDDVLVVFDEAYYEFVDAPDFPQSLAYVHEGRANVMVLRTYSKVYGRAGVRPGLRDLVRAV